jgi:hypothetical protein
MYYNTATSLLMICTNAGAGTYVSLLALAAVAKGDIIAATGAGAFSRLAVGANGKFLVGDSAQATGLNWQPPVRVADTVANLGTAIDGLPGLIRVGSSPYSFVPLTYDATLGKWISSEIANVHHITTTFTDGGVSYGPVATNLVTRHLIPNAKAIHDAGLRPQVAVFGRLQNSGANNTFVRASMYEFADGDTGITLVAVGNDNCVNNGTTTTYRYSNWATMTMLSLTDPHWELMLETKVSAGTGTFYESGAVMRWVSA